MMLLKTQSTVLALVIVAACAQTEPAPVPIAPEPIFDKYGNEMTQGGGCSGGQTVGASTSCIPPYGQQGYDETGANQGGDGAGNGGTGTAN